MADEQLHRRPEQLVRLRAGDRWLRLHLGMAGAFDGGPLVYFADDATFAVEAADDFAAGYGRRNWASAVVSGALYCFRSLDLPRRRVRVHELAGRLGSDDMQALAGAAVLAVAASLGQSPPPLQLGN